LGIELAMVVAAESGGFVPVHQAHAIEQLTATIAFSRPLTDSEMRTAADSMSQFDATLPGVGQIVGMGFAVGPQGVNPIMPSMGEVPAGSLRTYSNPKGVVVRELKLERQALTFRTLEYTRWNLVWEEARKYLQGVLGSLPASVFLNAYALSYSDKFVWRGEPSLVDVGRLLREGSPHVSPATFDAEDLWHSYSGRFTKAGDAIKRLVVVDCDCVDEIEGGNKRRVVRIGTTITDMLNQAGYLARSIELPQAMSELGSAFPELHLRLKELFGEVVNDDAAEAVALNGTAHASRAH
jgi:hypothetical protein